MRELLSKPGFAPFLVGTLLLFELLTARVMLTADHDFVYVAGHRIDVACPTRARYGIPCPTCGATRGFVLASHGRIGEGWNLSPSGPLLVIATFAMAMFLLGFAALQFAGMPTIAGDMRRWFQAAVIAYAALGVTVWISSWLSVVLQLRKHG